MFLLALLGITFAFNCTVFSPFISIVAVCLSISTFVTSISVELFPLFPVLLLFPPDVLSLFVFPVPPVLLPVLPLFSVLPPLPVLPLLPFSTLVLDVGGTTSVLPSVSSFSVIISLSYISDTFISYFPFSSFVFNIVSNV